MHTCIVGRSCIAEMSIFLTDPSDVQGTEEKFCAYNNPVHYIFLNILQDIHSAVYVIVLTAEFGNKRGVFLKSNLPASNAILAMKYLLFFEKIIY